MKLTVLVENNTFIDRYFISEPALSLLIETEEVKLLFDVGYSDAFLQNAEKLEIDLMDIDYLVLSHGHLDHTWGLEPFIRKHTERKLEQINSKLPKMVAHPLIFQPKYFEETIPIGVNLSQELIENLFSLQLMQEPIWLTDKLVFLGEIPRNFEFENKEPIGVRKDNDSYIEDYLLDDSALAYITEEGLVIITGCSHAGICNIVKYARKVTGINQVVDIIGGLHLQDPSVEQLEGTKQYLNDLNLQRLHACHCTDLDSKIELAKVADIKEVGVGLQLQY